MPIQPEEFRQEEPYELAAVHTDEEFIESLRTSDPQQTLFAGRMDAGQDQLTSMLSVWSAELALRPLPDPMPVEEATALVARSAARRRSLRSVMAVAASIVALLLGSAVVGARSATPGDALWPVTQVMWADRAHSVTAGINVRTAIEQARLAINAGQAVEAIDAFSRANADLGGVNQQELRQSLLLDLEQLRTELSTAAVPPSMGPDTTTAVVSVTGSTVSVLPPAQPGGSTTTSAPVQGPTDPAGTSSQQPPIGGNTSTSSTPSTSSTSPTGTHTSPTSPTGTSTSSSTGKSTSTATTTPPNTSSAPSTVTDTSVPPTKTSTTKPTSTSATDPSTTTPTSATSPTSSSTDASSSDTAGTSSSEVVGSSDVDPARGAVASTKAPDTVG